MSRQNSNRAEQIVLEELAKTEKKIAKYEEELRELKAIKKRQCNAYKSLTNAAEASQRQNAKLDDVLEAVLEAYADRTLMHPNELSAVVLERMIARGFSKVGLKRRIEQGLNRLVKDESGMLLRPANASSSPFSDHKDSPSNS